MLIPGTLCCVVLTLVNLLDSFFKMYLICSDSDDESMMSAQVSQSRGGGVATMRPAAQVMSDAIAIHRRSKHKYVLKKCEKELCNS